MSGTSRTKGKVGERELAALLSTLTGHDVRRRVRQHDGDDDLVGLPGWAIEAKRHKTATPGQVAAWWRQAVDQAQPGTRPVLLFRVDRGAWRAIWAPTDDTMLTVEASVSAWWALQAAPWPGR